MVAVRVIFIVIAVVVLAIAVMVAVAVAVAAAAAAAAAVVVVVVVMMIGKAHSDQKEHNMPSSHHGQPAIRQLGIELAISAFQGLQQSAEWC